MSRFHELLFIKAQAEEVTDTYSSVMRYLNKEKPEDIKSFMKQFKKSFDDAMDNKDPNHQDIALADAKVLISQQKLGKLIKFAQVAIGISDNPAEVGKILSNIIKVILARMSGNKHAIYNNMKNKILNINVAEISNTSLPDTAAYGQAITLIKTLLNGYNPKFIKQVLVSTTNNLY